MCAYHFEGIDYFRFPEAFDAITPDAVMKLLRESLLPERAALSIVRPCKAAQ